MVIKTGESAPVTVTLPPLHAPLVPCTPTKINSLAFVVLIVKVLVDADAPTWFVASREIGFRIVIPLVVVEEQPFCVTVKDTL